MLRTSSLAFVLFASLSAVPYSWAQDVHIPIPTAVAQAQDLHKPIPPSVVPGPGAASIPEGSHIHRQQAIAANLQRQVEIRRDSEKMLQRMAELKDYLQKAGRGVMSVESIKKAEQIESWCMG